MKIFGTIKEIFDIKEGKTKDGHEWQSLDILIDKNKEFNSEIIVTARGRAKIEKITSLNQNDIKQPFEFDVDVYSREYKGRFYTNVSLVDLFKTTQ